MKTIIKYILFMWAASFLLTGCDRVFQKMGMGLYNSNPVGVKNILVIGQSNNVRFEQYGESAFIRDWRSTRPAQNIIFVNCSVGGTAISQWQEPGQLMDQCSTKGIHIDAILFYQGEADAANGVTNWGAQFNAAVIGWRKRFGNIPIVFAQIAVEDQTLYCSLSNWESIQTQQAEVSLSDGKMIVTEDISQLDSDPNISQGVHLSPQSYVNIAARYADALQSLL